MYGRTQVKSVISVHSMICRPA